MKDATSPLPASTMAMVRVVLIGIGSYAAGAGWIAPGSAEAIANFVMVIGVAGYGLYRTFRRQTQIKNAEAMVGAPIPKGKMT